MVAYFKMRKSGRKFFGISSTTFTPFLNVWLTSNEVIFDQYGFMSLPHLPILKT